MRARVLFILTILASVPAFAQTAAITGFCDLGGAQAKTSGLNSTNYQQGIIPSCTVTVYLTGTTTKATIYADAGGTPLSNPFTASAVGSVAPGQWIFWTAVNQGVDIVASGGIAPNTYPAPVTLCADCFPSQSISPVAGVTSITDSTAATGAITFTGSGVSQSGNTFTFNGGTCTDCLLTDPSGTQNTTALTLQNKNLCLQDGTNCPAAGGVISINSTPGAFTFTGPGVSCTGTACTFSGGSSGGTVFCTPNPQTGTAYTLALSDGTASGAACIGTVTMNNAATNTVTIPPNSSVAFPVPDEIDFIQLGAGQTTLAAGAGVTLITPTSLSTRAQNSTIGIRQLSTNTWIVFGDTQ